MEAICFLSLYMFKMSLFWSHTQLRIKLAVELQIKVVLLGAWRHCLLDVYCSYGWCLLHLWVIWALFPTYKILGSCFHWCAEISWKYTLVRACCAGFCSFVFLGVYWNLLIFIFFNPEDFPIVYLKISFYYFLCLYWTHLLAIGPLYLISFHS